MKVYSVLQAQTTSITPKRLYHAFPSVLLGLLFNILDAVSTGLLVFPNNSNTFKSLQIQAMSMYIMSTILSQAAMTLGGSLIPGALGAMLIEILPFLRGIGSDIHHVLGDDSPALVPTVMVAYALTSFLIGFLFFALGVFKAGILVEYFPKPVLTGIIGGIGVSLFLLGLGLPLPPPSPALTLSNAHAVLFGVNHLGLLFASCGPAFLLSISLRSISLRRCTFGIPQHAYYIPFYLLLIPILFWITIAGLQYTDKAGMDMLVRNGWLFSIDDSVKTQSGIGSAWIYWTLFDFSKVDLHALKNATTNIILLVVIGVLNLPIYVPALGSSLGISVNMNHEFIGQGVANILAGLAGTVPNILQLSYSIFFTRAGGGRLEAGLVTILTFVFFLFSSLVISYVPTVLASTLVLFLGIELTLGAVWDSAETLQFTEWLVVMTTIIACTFLGYAIGFGVGFGAATVVYLFWGVRDTRARLVDLDQESGLHTNQSHYHHSPVLQSPVQGKDHSTSSEFPMLALGSQGFAKMQHSLENVQNAPRISVLCLSGYIFFGNLPSIAEKIKARKEDAHYQFIVVDLTCVQRLETSAVELLEREARESVDIRALVFCGVSLGSGVDADLQRAGLRLNFGAQLIKKFSPEMMQKGLMGFEERADAIKWCKAQNELGISMPSLEKKPKSDVQGIYSEEDAVSTFRDLPETQRFFKELFLSPRHTVSQEDPGPLHDLVARFKGQGGKIRSYEPAQLLQNQGDLIPRVIFIVQGRVFFESFVSITSKSKSRASFSEVLLSFMRMARSFMTRSQDSTLISPSSETVAFGTLAAGEPFSIVDEVSAREFDATSMTNCDQITVSSSGTCWTIEVDRSDDASSLWPLAKQWSLEKIVIGGRLS